MSKSNEERYKEAAKARSEFVDNGGPGHFTKPMPNADLKAAFNAGMIKQTDLEDGAYYLGWCRNAVIAKWQVDKDCFIHWRTKFGSVFTEEINHPENDDGFDLFVPLKKVEPTKEEVI